ncbi:MAG: rRNA maturation RNase YbeY [Candidatus Brocadiia bacterium]
MTVHFADRQSAAAIDRATLRALCRSVLRAHDREADLSLCYVDAAAIRELNARFLGRDEVTDVLAFPLEEGPEDDRLLGEVVVCTEKAVEEARSRGLAVDSEIALYTVHGVLHLLGYDDRSPAQRRQMRQAERRALEEAGLA